MGSVPVTTVSNLQVSLLVDAYALAWARICNGLSASSTTLGGLG